MRTVALIGDPVRQSVSPAMHRAAFAAAGLPWGYEAVTVALTDLAGRFPDLRGRYAGLNVTRPLKEAVIPLLDAITPQAERIGSVNTVTLAGGRATGHSTDGAGFLAALERAGVRSPRRAVVLGTGGAARAVVASLRDVRAAVRVAGRNAEAGQGLAASLGARFVPISEATAALESADLLVNATPVGSWPDADLSPLPAEVPLRHRLTVFDLVYRPRETLLLSRARDAGCRTIEGIEMLVEQGARSFELWTGVPAPVETMRRTGHEALAEPVPQETR
jgi:shikimate dehydrogenase